MRRAYCTTTIPVYGDGLYGAQTTVAMCGAYEAADTAWLRGHTAGKIRRAGRPASRLMRLTNLGQERGPSGIASCSTWPPSAPGTGAAIAVAAGNVIIAKSDRIQRANNRVYFPVQDCISSIFVLSEKRWR